MSDSTYFSFLDRWETSTSSASTSVVAAIPEQPANNEFLVRLNMHSATEGVITGAWTTADFQSRLIEWMHRVESDTSLLRHVVHWQHRLMDFNSHYVALLLNQITDEEFERVSHSMAEEIRDHDSLDLSIQMERVRQLTGIDYEPSDLASLFQTTPERIVEVLSLREAATQRQIDDNE